MNDSFNGSDANCTANHYEDDYSGRIMLYTEIGYQSFFIIAGVPPNAIALWESSDSELIGKMSGTIGIVRKIYSGITVGSVGAKAWLHLVHLHLIIADLLTLLVYCLGKTIWQLTFYWYLGNVGCKMYSALSSLALFLWSSVAVVSALDMAYCLWFPFESRIRGPERVKNWLRGCWAVSLLLSSPQLVLWGSVEVPVKYSCLEDKWQCIFLFPNFGALPRFYQLFHQITIFYLPLSVITSAYAAITLVLFRRNSRFSNSEENEMAVRSGSGREMTDADQQKRVERPPARGRETRFASEESRQATVRFTTRDSQRRKSFYHSNQKFLRISLATILTYFFCWLPYQVVALMRIFCGRGSDDEGYEECIDKLYRLEWLEGIMIFGACINPYIYQFRARIGSFRSKTHWSTVRRRPNS